jgi:anti-sigma regulatory factor (Ser/Thr protein kinase)
VSTALTLELPATFAGAAAIPAWIDARAASLGLSADLVYRLELCAEEAVSNVLRHGIADEPGATVRLSLAAEPGRVTLAIEDAGKPFDPLSAPPPAPPKSLEEAALGGRGIHLMRRFASRIDYARRDGRNRLTLEFDR